MKTKIIGALLVVLSFASCRNDMPDMQNPNTEYIENWNELFESYWNGMNYNYVFWDIDPTDWDKMYDIYKPKFRSIEKEKFNNPEVNDMAFEWIKEMSSSLIDFHARISVENQKLPADKHFFYTFSPADERNEKREEYHPDLIDERIEAIKKLKSDNRAEGSGIILNEESGKIYFVTYLIENEIAYFGFNDFSITNRVNSPGTPNDISNIIGIYYDILDNHEQLKGVIIDVRGNGGGYVSDLKIVLGKFVSEPLKVAYTRKKNGIGRLDYHPYTPEYLVPYNYKRELNIPVVVLADMHSASMSEITSMAVRELPGNNGIIMGERTCGATGNISSLFDDAYSGPFKNNMLNVYICSSMTVDVHGVSHEGTGIIPDIEVLLDEDKLKNEKIDNQLEAAIDYIKKQ